ncbi:transporter family protein [Pedobacter sp. UYP24]
MWWIYALLSAFFAAVTAILAKIGIKGIDSNLATAIRTVVILLLTWGIVFFRNSQQEISGLTRINWTFLILSGLATGLSWLFYFKALQLGKVSQVAPVDKASVAIAIILSVVFLGEPLTVKTVIAVLLIVAGSIILIFQ